MGGKNLSEWEEDKENNNLNNVHLLVLENMWRPVYQITGGGGVWDTR